MAEMASRCCSRSVYLAAATFWLTTSHCLYARELPKKLIGYTEYRTNLPGGRRVNVATMRAMIVAADGSAAREIAADLRHEPDHWTQFAGWSPDGKQALVHACWEDPANGRWEEEHQTFRYGEGWLIDSVLVDS